MPHQSLTRVLVIFLDFQNLYNYLQYPQKKERTQLISNSSNRRYGLPTLSKNQIRLCLPI